MQLAYQTNPTLNAQRADRQATGELKAQALSAFLPQLQARGSLGRLDTEQSSTAGAAFDRNAILNQRSYQVTFEQALFAGGRGFFGLREAAAQIDGAEAQLLATEQQLLLDVAIAYFDVRRDLEIYRLNLANVRILEQQQAQTRNRLRGGELTRTDLAQAEARLAGARADVAQAQTQLAISRARYVQLVGQLPVGQSALPALPPVPRTLERSKLVAREVSPSLLQARATARASRQAVGVARSALFPRLSAQAQYAFEDEPSTFIDQTENTSYGVQLDVPLFQGGTNASRIRQAKATNRRDRFRVSETERQVEVLVATEWEQLQSAWTTIRAAKKQIDATAIAVTGVKREASVGSRSTIDILNAELEALNARTGFATAERNLHVAHYRLLAAMGALTPASMGIDAAPAVNRGIVNRHRNVGDRFASGEDIITLSQELPRQAHSRLSAGLGDEISPGISFHATKTARQKEGWSPAFAASVAHVSGRVEEDDDTSLAVEAGPRFKTKKTDISLTGTAAKRLYDGRTFLTSAGAKLRLQRRLSERMSFSGHARYSRVRHELDPDRSGSLYSLDGQLQRSFGKATSVFVGAGVQQLEADSRTETYRQGRISAGLIQNLPWRMGALVSPGWSKTEFDKGAGTGSIARQDETRRLVVSLFRQDLQVLGLMPMLTYEIVRNDSNNNFYDYQLETAWLNFVTVL
jgi:outer membrane protein